MKFKLEHTKDLGSEEESENLCDLFFLPLKLLKIFYNGKCPA